MTPMRVKLKERRFRCAPDVSTGIFEVIENDGVGHDLLPWPRLVTRVRIGKLLIKEVKVEFYEREDNS
jgi:hypothetical protein